MEISGMVAMSHSPSWNLEPLTGPGERYVASVMAARELVRKAQPDAFIIFGPDHGRNFFFDVMPTFCIGVEQVIGFGDFDSPKGEIPCQRNLGIHIADGVAKSGFDPAVSFHMGIDHGISQPYAALDSELSVPIVPIMVSSAGPPLPTLRRCHEFGVAVGAAVRKFADKGHAVIVGSGGLSHSPPSVSPTDPDLSEEIREYVINGRDRVEEFNKQREHQSKERRRLGNTGPINTSWDEWFLTQIRTGDLEPVLNISNEELLDKAGVGGQEVRSWIAALGAWGGDVPNISYEPVPTWITGMGCVTSFE